MAVKMEPKMAVKLNVDLKVKMVPETQVEI